MYACSLPAGIVVDARGPRWGVAIGIVAFTFGYFPIYKGPGQHIYRENLRIKTSAD
jgi:hypothetical protein